MNLLLRLFGRISPMRDSYWMSEAGYFPAQIGTPLFLESLIAKI